MEPKGGRLVKAVFDFPTDDPSELSLQVGDIIQVKERVDKQWSLGLCNNREGTFPIGFTVELKVPYLDNQDQLFAVTNDFCAQEEGDLNLKKGELVIGKQSIDSNWWRGEIEGQVGIFPVTHVWKVDKDSFPEVCLLKKVSMKAKVQRNMKAQIAEEMDLYKDDIVNIVEEVEKGWYRGECNGRQGIFPASFVTVLPDDSTVPQNPQPLLEYTDYSASNLSNQNNNHNGYDCINSGIAPYGRTIYPFEAEYANELSFNDGEIVKLKHYIDDNWLEGEIDGKTGIFPANFVNIVVDCPNSKQSACKEKESLNDIDMSLFPADTYGRVLYDFIPQVEGDVLLKEGDTVTLIRKIDQNWYEVVTDNGDSGICPESYIEVIGSGPPSYNEVMSANYDFPINQSSVNNSWGKQNSANSSFDDSANSAPSNYSSSFSSQNGSERSSHTNNRPKSFDDKMTESLNFDISMKNSSNNLFNTYDNNSSALNSELLSDSGISLTGNTDDTNKSFARNSYQNIPAEKNSNYSSNSPSYFNSGVYDNRGNDQPIPRVTKTPVRPPPPNNVGVFPNVSSIDNSSSSLNSTRNSIISTSSNSSLEGSNAEEIKSQIHQKEQTLKIRIACKNKLENEKNQSSNNFVSNEMKVQLAQLNEEIDRLKLEIADLKSQIVDNEGERSNSNDIQAREEEAARKKEAEQKRRDQEKIRKMKEQRECIITELLQTERDYISDLKLLQDLFLKNPSEAKDKGIDIPTLFGNLDEVIDVAGRLLKRLQKVSIQTQQIGECFVDMSDDMKEVYGHYCRNHDEVNSIIDKIDAHSAAGQYLNHKIELMKRQTNCFDLPAMLIKPVQRILKYPLLLNELLKCTEESHPDKQWLLRATHLMTDVATAVNEFKRRKDLVFKYRKQADTSLSGRISKLSIHSIGKKTSRFGMRLSNSIGLKTFTKDEEFEKVERRFNGLEKSIKIFQKDVCDYTRKVEELVTTAFNMSEEIAEWYQERKNQKEVDQFRSAHRAILSQHWDLFKQMIERSINSTIKMLLQTFRGPLNLIQKRYDKLLDYESSSSKVEKNKDVTKLKMLQDNLTMAKHTYEALNSQLLDDLPKLCDISIEILYDCIRCFLKAKKNFVGKSAMLLFDLMDLPLLLGSQGSNILDTFQVKHTLVMDDLSQLTILPKEMQSCIKTDTLKRNSSPRGSRLSFSFTPVVKLQSPNQKVKVKSCFPHTDLYTACENFDAVDIMGISLRKGDIVGVIKQQDPMGKKLRWFVDNGEAKGFVPAKCLIKFLPNLSSQSSSNTNDWNTLRDSSQPRTTRPTSSQSQELYSKPQKPLSKAQQPNTSQGMLRPVRPAPFSAPSSSLRVVAPSRFPPSATVPLKPQENILNFDKRPVNVTCTPDAPEIDHRYEEIDETQPSTKLNSSDANLMGHAPVASQNTTNVVEEFDPYSTSQPVPELYDNVPDNINSVCSSNRYDDIPDETYYEEVPCDRHDENTAEYYYGEYDFSPTGPNQLQLRKGQVVLVLHKSDLNSNSEWWFVEDRHGSKGYVPAAYLNKYSKDIV